VSTFSALADQVSTAIINNRLFADTRQALTEAQELHRKYLRLEWSRETSERKYSAYRYNGDSVVPVDAVNSPEINSALQTGEVITAAQAIETAITDPAKPNGSSLVVPIKLRDVVIGVINLNELNPDRVWRKEEIDTVQAIADQIATVIESTRLFEQTLRKSARERKAYEIASKIRTTNDPEEMIKIAVAELRNALNASQTQVIVRSLPEIHASEVQENNGFGKT